MMPNWPVLAKIADCTNCKQLFHVTDKLLGRHKSLPFPTTISLDCLLGQFSYFHNKAPIIRNKPDRGTSHALTSPYNHDIEFQQTPFTSFQPVTTDYFHSLPSVHLSHVNSIPYLHHFFWSVWIQYSQP